VTILLVDRIRISPLDESGSTSGFFPKTAWILTTTKGSHKNKTNQKQKQ